MQYNIYCSTTLFDLLCDLLKNSDTLQQQMIQSRGFLVISHLLEEVIYTYIVLGVSVHSTRSKCI